MHTYLLCVGLYKDALAEVGEAARTAAAAAAAPKRRVVVTFTAEEPLEAVDAAAKDDDDVVAGDVPRVAHAAFEAHVEDTAAFPGSSPGVKSTATTNGADGFSGSNPWASEPVFAPQWPSHSTPECSNDVMDCGKYTSYRYHHHAMSGMNYLSSGGTNALMDNGLAVILPSGAMVGFGVAEKGCYEVQEICNEESYASDCFPIDLTLSRVPRVSPSSLSSV